MNPVEKEKYEKKMAKQAEEHERTNAKNRLIMEEHRKLKNLMAAQKNSGSIGKNKRGNRGKKKKTRFEARLNSGTGNDRIGSGSELSFNNAAKNPLHKKSRSFRAHETQDGKVYYSDIDTNTTVWKLPEDAVVL